MGLLGNVPGVAEDDDSEDAEVPIALVAVALNVYGVPFVRPETVQASAPLVVHVLFSGVDVIV
jgi:hypothetical protein